MKFFNLVLLLSLFFAACKSEKNKNDNKNGLVSIEEASKNAAVKGDFLPIPDPCKLISEQWLRSNLNIDADLQLTIKDGSSEKVGYAESCFFKWPEKGNLNGGIMLQIMVNPMPSEVDNWPELFINSKLENGEMISNNDTAAKFVRLEDLGDDGCYNEDVGFYYWRVKNDYVFWLAFNLSVDKKTQKEYAIKIGQEILRNFNPPAKY